MSLHWKNGFSKHRGSFHGSHFSFLFFLLFLEIETKETKETKDRIRRNARVIGDLNSVVFLSLH